MNKEEVSQPEQPEKFHAANQPEPHAEPAPTPEVPPAPKFVALEKVREKDITHLMQNEAIMNQTKADVAQLAAVLPDLLVRLIEAKQLHKRYDASMQKDLEKILRRHGVNDKTADGAYFDPKTQQLMVSWIGSNTETQPSNTEDEQNGEESSSPETTNQENNKMSDNNKVGNDAEDVSKTARPENADGAGEGSGEDTANQGDQGASTEAGEQA